MTERFIAWTHRAEVKRLDRETMYIYVHCGLIPVGLAILIAPRIVGLPTLSAQANSLLGFLIALGSSICILSSAMGMGRFLPRAKQDWRLPFGSGAAGQLSVMSSLGFYIWSLRHLEPVRLMSLGLTIAITMACIHITALALKEFWRIDHFKDHPDCPHWPPKPGE